MYFQVSWVLVKFLKGENCAPIVFAISISQEHIFRAETLKLTP